MSERLEDPFDTVLNSFSENLEKAVNHDRQSHEFLHGFTIWLTGFSIGALSLLFSNFADIKSSFSHGTLKALICLLTTSLITGILHRLYLFAFQTEYNSNLFYIEGAFSNKRMMPTEPSDITQETDIKSVVELISDDFGDDLGYVLDEYANSNQERREMLLQSVKDHYARSGRWAVQRYKIGFDFVNSVLKAGFGLSENEIQRASDISGKKIRKLRLIHMTMLYISYLSFIMAIILLTVVY